MRAQATLHWPETAADTNSCPRRAASLWQLNLEIARRAERGESNHWRERGERGRDDIMRELPLGTGKGWAQATQAAGLGSHNGNTERERDGHTDSPGHRMVSYQALARFLEQREQRRDFWGNIPWHTWSGAWLQGASQDYFEMSESWRQQSWYFQRLMASMRSKNIGD